MERFVIGHNADPSNWRVRLETLIPVCFEIFVPPRYCGPAGLAELETAFEELAAHPAAGKLEFLSCHFPWGETVNGRSRYHLVDDQYFHSFWRIAAAFARLCATLGLGPERSILNFHNLYDLPRPLLTQLKQQGKLAAVREIFLRHAHEQTLAAKMLVEVLGLPLTLTNENNPPIGAGEYMSMIDVFPEDLSARCARLDIRTCLDLSHYFMTKFYYDADPGERPEFPYLELEAELDASAVPPDFETFLNTTNPLYYHISDTRRPGADRTLEGIPIGTGDTPWIDVLTTLGRHAFRSGEKLFLIIEIKGGYTAEGIRQCRESEHALRGYIEDCFASGFLEALEEKDGPS